MINNGFHKDENRLVSDVEQQYTMRESTKQSQKKENLWQGVSILQEKAEKKMGGAERFPMHACMWESKLLACLARVLEIL